MDLHQQLTAHPLTGGLHIVDARVSSSPGDFHPVGTMHHHTASRAYDSRGNYRPAPSLGIVTGGRHDLPPPLCNLLISRPWEHAPHVVTVYVITDGRANDSGTGMRTVLDRVRADLRTGRDATARGETNGNPWFYDFEYENDGVGEIYAAAQIAAGIRCAAVIHAAMGWSANRAIHHRQWTARKPDMSWRGDLPRHIQQHLEVPTMLLACHPRTGTPDALESLAAGSAARRGTITFDVDEVRLADAARKPVVAVGGPAAEWLARELGGAWVHLAAKGPGTHRDGHRTVVRGDTADDTAVRLRQVLAA